jgi:hypothetical protein
LLSAVYPLPLYAKACFWGIFGFWGWLGFFPRFKKVPKGVKWAILGWFELILGVKVVSFGSVFEQRTASLL